MFSFYFSIPPSFGKWQQKKKWNQPSQDFPQDLGVSSMGILPQMPS